MFWCVSYHLGAFGTVKLLYETRGKTSRTSAKVRATKSRRIISERTHPMVRNGPKHEFRVQWGGSGAFVANSSCHEVASEFFATNPLDPLHWILNSCLGAFCTVWVHLRPINCLTKLGAKHFELVQKFVPRRRVGVFRDERTRSTPLDHKHIIWCVSYHLRAFRIVRLPYETRGKTFRTSAKVCSTKSRRSFSRRTLPIHPIGP